MQSKGFCIKYQLGQVLEKKSSSGERLLQIKQRIKELESGTQFYMRLFLNLLLCLFFLNVKSFKGWSDKVSDFSMRENWTERETLRSTGKEPARGSFYSTFTQGKKNNKKKRTSWYKYPAKVRGQTTQLIMGFKWKLPLLRIISVSVLQITIPGLTLSQEFTRVVSDVLTSIKDAIPSSDDESKHHEDQDDCSCHSNHSYDNNRILFTGNSCGYKQSTELKLVKN